MARSDLPLPTLAEIRILTFLHAHGPATIREYLDAAPDRASSRYLTAMNTFHVMRRKGLLTRKAEGRAHRYKPTMTQGELHALAAAWLLKVPFRGDLPALKAAITALLSRKPSGSKA